jgi:antibiotic biosynthesis monooxygenase (ABM) superfamily enzyme
MSLSPEEPARPPWEVRGARASSVIVHRVPASRVEPFLQWQQGITRAAEAFPGYQATEVYPPVPGAQLQWVVVLHFDTAEALQRWLTSPVRAEWTARLPTEDADFQLKTLGSGFGPWFAGLVEGGGLPSHWKMALAVLLALYPTVMVLNIFISPYTKGLGFAVAMLIGNAVSVAILEWGMPWLNPVLGPWLRAKGARGRTVSLVGLVVILGVLGVLTLLFRQVTG